MTSERVSNIGSPSIPKRAVQVNEDLLTNIVLERGLSREVNIPLAELINSLRILTYSILLETEDYERAANSLDLEFQEDTFYECLEILYDLLEAEDDNLLLEEAIKQELIPAFLFFTPRQREVLELVTLGFNNQEIADNLEISSNTIKKHLRVITQKLGGKMGRKEIAILAMREGWVSPETLRERLGDKSDKEVKEQIDKLTPRERELVKLIGQRGFSSGEMARVIKRLDMPEKNVSTHTIKNRITAILKKLELRNQVGIAIFFFLYGNRLDGNSNG